MILKLSIENFFSIADRQEIDFAIARNSTDSACFTSSKANDTRQPVVVGFFGANASGKTTVLRAITSALDIALNSVDWSSNSHVSLSTLVQPYRNKIWWNKPTKFMLEIEETLIANNPPTVFRYELHIEHQANNLNDKRICYEALFYAPKNKFRKLFKREYQHIEFGQDFDIMNADPRKKVIRENASVLSSLAKFNHLPSIHFCQSVGKKLQSNIQGFRNIISKQIENRDFIKNLSSFYFREKICSEKINQELIKLDLGLESMSTKFLQTQEPILMFQHVGLDEEISWPEESAGTRSFIAIFPLIYYALTLGGIAVIDEIDTDLHPVILPEIFRWFYDPIRNQHQAQLFFTAHNPAILNELEKQQIFFAEKLAGKPSSVYGAKDIQGLRREPNLMKKYLTGELGAIPYIG